MRTREVFNNNIYNVHNGGFHFQIRGWTFIGIWAFIRINTVSVCTHVS